MGDMSVKRATNERQKEARRDAILHAARSLFMEAGFFDVSMATIAKRAGLAKGTVYLYFKTKEEIFLALSTEEITVWLDRVDMSLTEHQPGMPIDHFVSVILETLDDRQVMLRLITLLHLVLEKNISYEEAFAFKMYLKTRSEQTAQLIERALPFLTPGQGLEVLSTLHCLVVGLGQMSDPSPVLAKVLEHPELAPFRVDLKQNLLTIFSHILNGMKNSLDQAKP
ncbi:TetR/AcrR family transcriptional regulator [Sneathiella sp.]|jgi:AcrR family transcriptional regulator|uniref:TetR/AcrR family transcriptional regulator n=1 Tax=Sneathiella sp. TaxID=1964365 RepID=UPI0039E346F6